MSMRCNVRLRCGGIIPRIHRKFTTQLWRKPIGRDTGIMVHNCITHEMVPLVLHNHVYATWYTCGPTVYDRSHLGHASCYVKLDIIQRLLRHHFHVNLVTAMNITDIDDKIIAKCQESGRNIQDLTRSYEETFWHDLRQLNVMEPNFKIRVSENIPKIIAFIEKLVSQQKAYVGDDKSVYFDVKSFSRYGKLRRLNLHVNDGEAINVADNCKLAAVDFALWKAQKTAEETNWPSPWGAGRPGWHIECSTLASLLFGRCVDFHAGGVDLRFPHHENEEAQSCVYHSTEQWVNYWLHTGYLTIKGQTDKMSKSLNNTIAIDEMLGQYSTDIFRMACLLSHYRNAMHYSDELMESARNTLNKFRTFRDDCRAYVDGKKMAVDVDANALLSHVNEASIDIDRHLKNDFDTAQTIKTLCDVMNHVSGRINSHNSGDAVNVIQASAVDVVAAVDNFIAATLNSFGFEFTEKTTTATATTAALRPQIDLNTFVDDVLKSRLDVRAHAKASNSRELFRICDELRTCLSQHGIEIRDHSQGSSWSFIASK